MGTMVAEELRAPQIPIANSSTKGLSTISGILELISTNHIMQNHVMIRLQLLRLGMDQTTPVIHSIGLYERNGGQLDLAFLQVLSALLMEPLSRLLTML